MQGIRYGRLVRRRDVPCTWGTYATLHSLTSANMWLGWSSCNIATVCRRLSAGIIYVRASFWGCAYSSRVTKAVFRAATLLSHPPPPSSTSLSLSLPWSSLRHSQNKTRDVTADPGQRQMFVRIELCRRV